MTMTVTNVNRRDFLLMRTGRERDAVILSCEQLYMRYVDAHAQGTTAELFARLAHDLETVKRVRLIKTSWLSDDDLRRQLDAVFDAFRNAGGRIEH
jgi:hypothetical protein